jgi:hypothetical protein
MRYEKKAMLKGVTLVGFLLLGGADLCVAATQSDDAQAHKFVAVGQKTNFRGMMILTGTAAELRELYEIDAILNQRINSVMDADPVDFNADNDERRWYELQKILRTQREQEKEQQKRDAFWRGFAYAHVIGDALAACGLALFWWRRRRLSSRLSAASNAAPTADAQNGMIGKLVGFNRYKIVRQAGYCSGGLVFEALDTEQNRLVYINFRADLAQEKAVGSGDERPAERVLIGVINMN